MSGQDPNLAPSRGNIPWWNVSLNKQVFNWLRNPIIVFCDRTDCVNQFHSVGEAILKPRLPMAFSEEKKLISTSEAAGLGKELYACELGEPDSLECNKIIFAQDTV